MQLAIALLMLSVSPLQSAEVRSVPIGLGWSNNSVNATVFREASVTSFGDTQYVAYYDPTGHMVIAKRKLGDMTWERNRTDHIGNVRDAHNGISLGVDGTGLLHVSWDHHGHPLRYATAVEPGSIMLGPKKAMTGKVEGRVTYPQFFPLPDGRLLFFYRDGSSGNGNLVLNRYDPATHKWTQLHDNLIDGEGQRNAYWQACVGDDGRVHISWVWRETGDVATNHDLCYAVSDDFGETWHRSDGTPYTARINQAIAEVVSRIPQKSELINQTSMTAHDGQVLITSYWRPPGASAPQMMLVSWKSGVWSTEQITDRKLDFSLRGGGTRGIPLSRPQVLVSKDGPMVIYRDDENSGRLVLARKSDGKWTISELTKEPLGRWEPTYDRALWRSQGKLHVFLQRVEQIEGEGLADVPPTLVSILEVTID